MPSVPGEWPSRSAQRLQERRPSEGRCHCRFRSRYSAVARCQPRPSRTPIRVQQSSITAAFNTGRKPRPPSQRCNNCVGTQSFRIPATTRPTNSQGAASSQMCQAFCRNVSANCTRSSVAISRVFLIGSEGSRSQADHHHGPQASRLVMCFPFPAEKPPKITASNGRKKNSRLEEGYSIMQEFLPARGASQHPQQGGWPHPAQ